MTSFRSSVITVGSALTLLVVILAVSADAETAVALVAFCAVGYAGRAALRSSHRFDDIGSSLGPRARLAVGAAVAAAVIVAVTNEVDDVMWLTAMGALGYVGYRTGTVLRGALYGAALGVGGVVVVVTLAVVALGLATVFGVAGTRDLLVKTLYAPWLVGGIGLLWTVVATAFGGVVGAVCGGVGGALSRLS